MTKHDPKYVIRESYYDINWDIRVRVLGDGDNLDQMKVLFRAMGKLANPRRRVISLETLDGDVIDSKEQ